MNNVPSGWFSKFLVAPSVLVSLCCFSDLPPAAAAECGAFIESDTDGVSAPQGCGGTALTVVGPAKIDFDGQMITCDGSLESVGIHILGSSARVSNGSVKNCGIGVLVEGDGGHRIARFNATKNGHPQALVGGVDVSSDDNKLYRLTATHNGFYGVRIYGSDNTVVKGNFSNNAWYGVLIFGERNTVRSSHANQNQDTNIVISHAFGSGEKIHAGGDQNQIISTQANLSHSHDGISVSGDGNQVRDSEANENFADGIDIDIYGSDNLIVGNTAFKNHAGATNGDEKFGGYDLEDRSEDCESNTWRDNSFLSSRAGSVEDPSCIR